MPPRRFWIISGIAAGMLLAVLFLDVFEPFVYVRLRNLYRDSITQAGRKARLNANLVFLAIDAASVNLDETDIKQVFEMSDNTSNETRALQLMTKRFPWSREVYALVVQRLIDA